MDLQSNSNSDMFGLRSDSCFLYIFTSVLGSSNYILYRIDVLKHLQDTHTHLYNLHPLLVFNQPVLPRKCCCIKLGSNFYFLGPWYSRFGFKDSIDTDVYVIKESDLVDICPSEGNTDVGKYLIKTASMNGHKFSPIVFVAEEKLYVLSVCLMDTPQFEVFDPCTKTWKVLPPQPYQGRLGCYAIVEKTVYFTTWGHDLLTFELEEERWSIMSTNPPVFPDVSFDISFIAPQAILGCMAFGFLSDESNSSLDCPNICASPLPDKGDSKSHEFMRPSIAPDDEFLHAVDSSRPRCIRKDFEIFSEYLVGLDGGKVLCVISYGSGPDGDARQSIDPYTSYATLSFFEVSPCMHRKECRGNSCNVDYATEIVDRESVARRYFKAKLLCSTQFIIKTTSLRTYGRIKACLLGGL